MLYYCLLLYDSRSLSTSPPPSILPPILVYTRRRHLHLPGPCKIYTLFLPSTQPHPQPQCSLCIITQVQKWLRIYELRSCVIPSLDILFHRLESCFPSWRLRQVVFQFCFSPFPQEPPYQPLCKLVLENPQDPAHTGGDHPIFCAENQHQLDYSFKEKSEYPRPLPLPDENSC